LGGHQGIGFIMISGGNKGVSILGFVMQQSGLNPGRAKQELRKGLTDRINFISHTVRFFKPRLAAKDRLGPAWEYADDNHYYRIS